MDGDIQENMMKLANKKVSKLGKVELGLVGGIAIVVGVMLYLIFAI
jgi:uncharacterized protein YjeT (DUF2065 family)